MPAAKPDHLPMSLRIDLHLAILSAMEVQERGGWSIPRLAEFIGCSEAAIVARQQVALAKARTAALAGIAGLPEAAALARLNPHP